MMSTFSESVVDSKGPNAQYAAQSAECGVCNDLFDVFHGSLSGLLDLEALCAVC